MSMGIAYQSEVSVKYRHLKEEDDCYEGENDYIYTWKHVPTGRTGTSHVAVLGGDGEFSKLMAHWNRNPKQWIYS